MLRVGGWAHQFTAAQPAFTAHNVRDVYMGVFISVEDAAGRLNDLVIAPALQSGRLRSPFGVSF